MKKTNTLSFLLLLYTATLTAGGIVSISSPGKQIRLDVLQKGTDLYFSVALNGIAVIETSPLLMTIDDVSLTSSVTAGKPVYYAIHESYPIWGAHTTAYNDCNGIKLPLKNKKGTDTLDIRVFNTGAAF